AHHSPTECCFKYAQRAVRHPQSFYKTPRDCSMPAVVLMVANGTKICADPKDTWVKRAIKKLQRKK
ncbi:CL3L1 protein, partial [Syrrhaptes paradoxus]|nr:CL3L1 protein [Syrrhaptes paradoxus]